MVSKKPILLWTVIGIAIGLLGFLILGVFQIMMSLFFSYMGFYPIHVVLGLNGALELCESVEECATAIPAGYYTTFYLGLTGLIIGIFIWLKNSGKSVKKMVLILYLILLASILFSYFGYIYNTPSHNFSRTFPALFVYPLPLVVIVLLVSKFADNFQFFRRPADQTNRI
ncbi:MAG: hypothetical protein ABIH20_06535 [Candidatus Diapherotrites archaeon]